MGAAKPKVVIISPYFSSLGGGERYLLTIAEHYLQKKYSVSSFNMNSSLVARAESKFKLNLSSLQLKTATRGLFFKLLSGKFNILFAVTDGSLFFSPIKNSFLIIQTPDHIPNNSFINQVKISSYKKILCYSKYIADLIYKRINRKAEILSPPADTASLVPLAKNNTLLSVGRFFTHLHSKKQHVLIREFKKMIDENKLNDWQLLIVGSIDRGGKDYVASLKVMSQGYPIKIIIDPPFEDLKKYYGEAKIYWHAAGIEEDLEKYPAKAEHFGITLVEAMAAGAVPLAFKAGGPAEIIHHGENGYLFTTTDELIRLTLNLVNDNTLRTKLADRARKDSMQYSSQSFTKALDKLTQN